MSKFSVANQLIESEYFNWKCIICNILAKSHLHLEDQFVVEHGVYHNIDGTEWVTHASHPTTLPAQKTPHQSVNTLAHL